MSDYNYNLVTSPANPAYQLIAPATLASVTISNGVSALVVNPAGTIAVLTLTMPSSPLDGQVVNISSTQVVTSLTLSPNSGQSIVSAVSTLALGGFASYRYVVSLTSWVRVG